MFISSLDCKSNRRLSEYITGYYDDNFYNALVLNKTCFNDYSISFINPITRQQVNAVRKITIKDGSSYRGFGQMTNPLTEIEGIADCPYFTYLNECTTSLFKKNGEDSRTFHLVAQRIFSMPYGIPNTLSQASKTSFETHINKSEDLNKPLKYLVINCFDYENSFENATNKYRAAIPIPEDGFKPGCVYMITNKPGTKLFKEWDEENGTTRAGESDFIVDESCLEIEEIQL